MTNLRPARLWCCTRPGGDVVLCAAADLPAKVEE